MKNFFFIKAVAIFCIAIGVLFFAGSIYQKIIIGGTFNWAHSFIGSGLFIMGYSGVRSYNAYNGFDNEGQFIGMWKSGTAAVIGLALFLAGLLILF